MSSAILNDRFGVFGWFGTSPIVASALSGCIAPAYSRDMTDPEVTINAELAARAEKVAASRGDSVKDIVERALIEYVAGDEKEGEIASLG